MPIQITTRRRILTASKLAKRLILGIYGGGVSASGLFSCASDQATIPPPPKGREKKMSQCPKCGEMERLVWGLEEYPTPTGTFEDEYCVCRNCGHIGSPGEFDDYRPPVVLSIEARPRSVSTRPTQEATR